MPDALRPDSLRQLRMREEAEDAEAVVERDDDDALAGEGLAVVPRLGAGAGLEAAAVDPHHHRQPFVAAVAGVQTFRYRQSSLAGCEN